MMFFKPATVLLLFSALHSCSQGINTPRATKQPVIIDTDVGSFIDDSFAIVYAAQASQLDIKLIVTCTQDTTARAKVVAKLMKLLGKDNVPIGIGVPNNNDTHQTLIGWGESEDLKSYKGGVFEDGVAKMADIIENSDQIVDIIAIGPMTNFPSLIRRFPDVAPKARIRAMAGSIFIGYDGKSPPSPEYNVVLCPWCMEILLRANWSSVTLTPLDTCGQVALDKGQVENLLRGDSLASSALASTITYFCLEDYCNLKDKTPIIFDVIGTLIAIPDFAMELMNYSTLKITVDSQGYTKMDPSGSEASCALTWKENSQGNFTNKLVNIYAD